MQPKDDICKVCFIDSVYHPCKGCQLPVCMSCSYCGPYCGLCQVEQRFVPGESAEVIEMNTEPYNLSASHIVYVRYVHAAAYQKQLITLWLCLKTKYPDVEGALADIMPHIAKKIRARLPRFSRF